jgi:hypothetical protein
MENINEAILKQLMRIADALELAVLPQNNSAYAEKVEEVLGVKDAEQPLKSETKEQTKTETKTYTHDDLKALCMSKSREDTANKAKLKALLSSYGAVKASDVPNDKLAEIIAKIESGEF